MIDNLLITGFNALEEYLALHVLTCLVPAFFLAGAIAALFSKEALLKYFGADSNKYVSYSIASASGCLLAVCSCTVLPLFGGLYRRGAGIGPASTFLYSAPAINLLAVVYTASMLGYDLGTARAVAAMSLSIVIGLTMASIFQGKNVTEQKVKKQKEIVGNPVSSSGFSSTTGDSYGGYHVIAIFLLLLAILVLGGIQDWYLKAAFEIPLTLILIIAARRWLSKDEISQWMGETWFLAKQIVPLLLAGVFFGAIIISLIPQDIIQSFLGGNSLLANAVASVSGAVMYFSTLTEVPIVGLLMKGGMGKGPALAMLLAGPALSLPSMIVIGRIVGVKKASVYIALVIIFSLVSGLIFGMIT